ncbi:transposase, partial [Advenella sp. RU8]
KDFKRSVVEHLLSNELTVAEVAREHDLHPNQLCRWRNEYHNQQLETTPAKYQDTSFLPVTVTEPSLANHKMTIDEQDPHRHDQTQVVLTITLPKGNLQVHHQCPTQLLSMVIEALK